MKIRSLAFVLSVSTMALLACSSSSPQDAQSDAIDADAASCNVAVTSYDQTCTQDSDCVAAQIGGDTCSSCATGNPAFVCDLAAINKKDSARYASDLAVALKNSEGPPPGEQCGTSCPSAAPITCVANLCQRVASADGGK